VTPHLKLMPVNSLLIVLSQIIVMQAAKLSQLLQTCWLLY
jgi:hypothetical protein